MTRALPHLLFGAVTLAAFARFLVGGGTLYDVRTLRGYLGEAVEPASSPYGTDRGDTVLLLPTLHRLYNEGLKAGELRLWNPHLFFGYPSYYHPALHPFYPPHLVAHALLPPRIAYEVLLALHLYFAGAAMYWLLLGLGRSRAAAAAGGLLWMLLGYNALWFSTCVLEGVSVFGPLAFLCIVRGLETKDLARAPLAGLCMGLVVLGSHPQYALHFFLFCLLWLGLALRRGDRAFLPSFAGLFACFTLGVGLFAILTRVDSLEQGLRVPGDDFKLLYRDPLLFTRVAGLVAGKVHFSGNPLVRSEFTIYAGLAGAALAAAGAIRGWRDPLARFLSIFGAATLVVAFVRPVGELFQALPLLNLSMPSRWLHVFGFALAILAASGFDALAKEPGRAPWAILGAGVLVLLGFLGSDAILETSAGFALATAAAFLVRRRPRLALPTAFAAILVELLPPFLAFNVHRDPAPLTRLPAPLEKALQLDPEPWRFAGSFLPDPSGSSPWLLAISNNVAALNGVDGAAGYEAIAPASSAEYADHAGGAWVGSGRVVFLGNGDSRLLDYANVRYFFAHAHSTFPIPDRFQPLHSWGPLTLYRNPAAQPRAWIVSRPITVERPTLGPWAILQRGFDPNATVVVDSARESHWSPGEARARVTWKKGHSDSLELEVATEKDAWLVLSDSWHPGWEADVGGAAVAIRRANLAFRAVPVPAGTHTVRFRFRPLPARQGMAGSLIFTALVPVWLYVARRRKA